ncbi:MAG: hypothetical protein E4H16_04825 [Candidatus Atribacteria bacterium]|nr:MAG: hypothetical protein E4H16_04825 [Candidatus Atribacteria bacterium]
MNDLYINSDGEEAPIGPTDRARWVSAISYLSFFCFLSLWKSKDDTFIKYHARQGFLLLLAEFIIFTLAIILDLTIGRLRFIGVLIVGLVQFAAGLGALTLSVLGFVKALFGEYWELPLLGEYRDRIPGLHRGDD